MKPTELPPEELARRLAEAPLSELLALVKEPPVELTVPLARAVLRNPHADAAVLEQVALGKHLLAAGLCSRAAHPHRHPLWPWKQVSFE